MLSTSSWLCGVPCAAKPPARANGTSMHAPGVHASPCNDPRFHSWVKRARPRTFGRFGSRTGCARTGWPHDESGEDSARSKVDAEAQGRRDAGTLRRKEAGGGTMQKKKKPAIGTDWSLIHRRHKCFRASLLASRISRLASRISHLASRISRLASCRKRKKPGYSRGVTGLRMALNPHNRRS